MYYIAKHESGRLNLVMNRHTIIKVHGAYIIENATTKSRFNKCKDAAA